MLRHEIRKWKEPKGNLTQADIDGYFMPEPVPLWATGRRYPVDPDSPPEPIPAAMWEFLKIDIAANEAAGGGLRYVALRIYDSDPDQAPARESELPTAVRAATACVAAVQNSLRSAGRSPPDCSPRAVKQWYKKRVCNLVTAGKSSSREEDEAAARHEFGDRVSRDSVRKLRKEIAPKNWQKQGRPNGISGKRK